MLHHEARLDRPKDGVDLAVIWALLDAGAQAWLRAAVRREGEGRPRLATIGE